MKPLDILRRYQGRTSLIDDCVLEQIVLFDEPVTAQTVITKCLSLNIASPATLHKSLNNLAEAGWIKSVKHPTVMDNRKHWITHTPAGARRLKEIA